MGTLRRQHDFMLQLLLDEELRERFFSERATVFDELDLDAEDIAIFSAVNRHGLEVDARVRRDYLMSALCRPYPLTAAAIGATEKGKRALCVFLGSPKIREDLQTRTAAFGDHLARLIEYKSVDLSTEAGLLLQPVLALERARVDNAAAIRNLVAEEGVDAAPPPPGQVKKKEIVRAKISLPAFLLLAELPLPIAILTAALDHVGAHNAWTLIRAGALSSARVTAVARALPMPVTVLSRGMTRGISTERSGSGGVSPLIDVSHLVAEVSGRQAEILSTLDGRHRPSEMPEALARLAMPLTEQGLLEIVS